jgi:DNA-binding LytR/AlgR family response regulator
MDTLFPSALIADDEPLLANDLAARLSVLWPQLRLCGVVHDGAAAQEAMLRHDPAIVFLDIRMPGLSGIEVAQSAQGAHIVFVTAFDQYAVEAFNLAAADYLLKPISDTRLAATVTRLKNRLADQGPAPNIGALLRDLLQPGSRLKWIRAGIGNETHLVNIDDVLYFRADDKYTVVQTLHHDYLIRTPLKDLVPQLDPQAFWQIHRNTLVATRAIANAHREQTGRVTLSLHERPETLTVSRAFAHLFKQM